MSWSIDRRGRAAVVTMTTNPVNAQSVELVLQPSQDFPDVRPCRASHGP